MSLRGLLIADVMQGLSRHKRKRNDETVAHLFHVPCIALKLWADVTGRTRRRAMQNKFEHGICTVGKSNAGSQTKDDEFNNTERQSMKNTLLRSVDGYASPNINEKGVYWPLADLTNIYAAESFSFTNITEQFGMDTDEPELLLPSE